MIKNLVYEKNKEKISNGICLYLRIFGLDNTLKMVQNRRQELILKKPNNQKMLAIFDAYTEFLIGFNNLSKN